MVHQKERVSNHCVQGEIIQGNLTTIYIVLKPSYWFFYYYFLFLRQAGRMEISDSSVLLILRYSLREQSSTNDLINAPMAFIF